MGHRNKRRKVDLRPEGDGSPLTKTISEEGSSSCVSESFLLWACIVLCGLEPYLDLVGDHCTIRCTMFHSRSRVEFLSMEQALSCLPLTYSLHHPWHCTRPGLWLIVWCSMNNTIIKTPQDTRVYGSADPPRERLIPRKTESWCPRRPFQTQTSLGVYVLWVEAVWYSSFRVVTVFVFRGMIKSCSIPVCTFEKYSCVKCREYRSKQVWLTDDCS